MANAHHVRWLASGAAEWNQRRSGRHFVPSLSHADLSEMDLSGFNLRGAQLRHANLEGAILMDANLVGAELYQANLTRADLRGAKCNGAIFQRAILNEANLEEAMLSEVDFKSAILGGASLRGAYFIGTIFTRARLNGASIATRPGKEPVNLMFAVGLKNAQLATMDGDTAVMLPHDLVHPTNWPVVEWKEEKNGEDSSKRLQLVDVLQENESFVFLSYAHKDSPKISELRNVLESSGIKIWWDQHIGPGANWREEIRDNLQRSAAVLTLWTEQSVQSKAVVEEAADAQSRNKLVHARIDPATIPYGFAETQYADLRNWTGDTADAELQKLIQALKDKLNPPSREDIQQRLTAAAPIAAVIDNGLVTAKDSPPNAAPPYPDLIDLDRRLDAQQALAEKALAALQRLDNNLGEAIRFDLAHFIEQVKARPASWYILSNEISDLRFYLDMGEDFSWPGSTRNTIESICKGHELLRPRLEPVQPPANSTDAPPPPPMPNVSHIPDQTLEDIAGNARLIFEGAEASEVLAPPAIRAGEHLAVAIDEARLSPALSAGSQERKLKKLRNSLVALAGFIGTAISTITLGVGTNVLTAPEAAQTLATKLRYVLDLIVALF